MALKDKVGELGDKIEDLAEEVVALKADLQFLREHTASEVEAKEGGEKLAIVKEGGGEPIKVFPGLEEREQEVEDQIYDYIKEEGGLTSLIACARELDLKEDQVKKALVHLKLRGKIEF